MMQLALAEADPGVVSWFTPEWLTALGTIAVAIATILLILFSSKHEKEAIKEQKETAVDDDDGTLDKESTSYHDIFDAIRLALKFYHFQERID